MPRKNATPKRRAAGKKGASKKAARKKTGREKTGRGHTMAQATAALAEVHARVSDAAVRSRTRRSWEVWFRILDSAGCTEKTHREIVLYLKANYGRLTGWWRQMIAGAYEQARGMRKKHEMPDGYQITGSKTVAVSSSALFRAFKDGAARKRWLAGHAITITKAMPGKSLRIRWTDGRSLLSVNVQPRGPRKAQVALVHRRLGSAREAARMKAFWKERLAVLKETLEG